MKAGLAAGYHELVCDGDQGLDRSFPLGACVDFCVSDAAVVQMSRNVYASAACSFPRLSLTDFFFGYLIFRFDAAFSPANRVVRVCGCAACEADGWAALRRSQIEARGLRPETEMPTHQ